MIGKKINQLATELAPVSTDLTIIGDPISGVSKKITLAQLGAIFSGAVSFYTDLASFPATGDINVIYCAKDTQKLYLWSGSAYVEVFPSQALLDTYQLRSEKGNANGYASLDSLGKVPISQLPSSIMEYKGMWNAATNTPTLANGTGDTGDVYICNVAGTVNFGAGPITFAVGDYVIYSGTIWQRSSGAVGTVTSVAASITGDSVTISGSPVTTSGTLAFAFAGTGAQYIKGDGTLATFPNTIDQAKNLITEVYNSTGATLTKGTVVYINGGQGNLPTVTKALASGDSTSAQTYGIVQADITNNNNGFVVVAGRLADIDTSAFSVGTQLYLSSTTAGAYTSTKQYAPAHLVYVGIIVRSHPTQGVIEVKIQNGYELDELHNVAAQTPTNNDGLFWEASTSLWKNKSIATILGYTPQAQLNGTGFVKASGTSISYDNSTYVTIDTFETITASKNFAVGLSLGSAGGTNQASVFQNTSSLFSGSSGISVFGFNSANNIYFGKGSDNGGVLQWNNSTVRYYTLPDATGTIALVGGSGVGTVTSVAALTIGTSGTDISSTVANSTTTPVITLNVPTASATNRGALSSADWTKFNNNIPAGTPTSGDYVFYNGSNLAYRNFIATSPLSYNSSTATFSISQASGSANGFLSSTDWTTFNNKQNALTNPVTGTGTTNYLPKFTGASTIGNSLVYDNGTNVGVNTTSPNDYIDGESGMAILRATNGRAVLSLVGTRTDAGETLGRISFTNTNSTNAGSKRLAYISGARGTTNNSAYLEFAVANDALGAVAMTLSQTGNLGLGVTPSAWNSIYKAFELATGSIHSSSSYNNIAVAANIFYNAANSPRYIVNDYATMYYQYQGSHAWYTAPSGTAGNAISFTQAMTLDASGRLGIGTTSPTGKLDVLSTYASDTTTQTVFRDNTGVALNFGGTSSGSKFLQAQDSAGATTYYNLLLNPRGGNVGIGTTSPSNKLDIQSANGTTYTSTPQLRVGGGGVNNNWAQILFSDNALSDGKISYYAASAEADRMFSISARTTQSDFVIKGNGSVGIGTTSPIYKFEVSDGTRTGVFNPNSSLDGFFIGTYQSKPLIFGTGDAERMRITSGGRLILGGTSSAFSLVRQQIWFTGSSTEYGLSIAALNTGNTNFIDFNIGSGSGGFAGSISWNGSTVAYNTSSDYRLKQDFKDYSGLDLINKIKTYDYEWKSDKSRSYGVIAHELQSVINYAVTGVKDGKEMQGVDYSKIVPVLIKAIQELNDKIK